MAPSNPIRDVAGKQVIQLNRTVQHQEQHSRCRLVQLLGRQQPTFQKWNAIAHFLHSECKLLFEANAAEDDDLWLHQTAFMTVIESHQPTINKHVRL